MNEQYKQQIYKNWIEKGRPWYSINKSEEATQEERSIAIEMMNREITKSKRDIKLDKRVKKFRQYEKKGKIPDSIFDIVSKELGDY